MTGAGGEPELTLFKVNCLGCGEFLVYASAGTKVMCYKCKVWIKARSPEQVQQEAQTRLELPKVQRKGKMKNARNR